MRKLLLVLFPWRHKPWSRQQRPSTTGSQDQSNYSYYFLPPREDLNSPDMYIPVMALVTYILLSTLLAGLRGAFHPEVMGSTFGYALFVVGAEILLLKLGTYLLSITNESQLLDLVAYSGYKFVGVIVTLVVAEGNTAGRGTGGGVAWTVFLYTYLANAFFLVCALISYGALSATDLAFLASISQICPAPGLLGPYWQRRSPHSGTVATKQKDSVPFHLFVHCPVLLHVSTNKGGWLCESGHKSLDICIVRASGLGLHMMKARLDKILGRFEPWLPHWMS
jgi:hypothetical protein